MTMESDEDHKNVSSGIPPVWCLETKNGLSARFLQLPDCHMLKLSYRAFFEVPGQSTTRVTVPVVRTAFYFSRALLDLLHCMHRDLFYCMHRIVNSKRVIGDCIFKRPCSLPTDERKLIEVKFEVVIWIAVVEVQFLTWLLMAHSIKICDITDR